MNNTVHTYLYILYQNVCSYKPENIGWYNNEISRSGGTPSPHKIYFFCRFAWIRTSKKRVKITIICPDTSSLLLDFTLFFNWGLSLLIFFILVVQRDRNWSNNVWIASKLKELSMLIYDTIIVQLFNFATSLYILVEVMLTRRG